MSSNNLAIDVRGVGKSYTIAHDQVEHTTLAAAWMQRLKNPFHRMERETFWALKNMDFQIDKGEVVGLIGRNGAGKSTLLKVLSRITAPTEGQIDLYGRVGSLLEVGTGFHPELTGKENIFLNGAILGMTRKEINSEFDAIVDFSGVEKFLDTPVKRYSSGMYVRLAFAVAAHLRTEILLIDEVLAVGDIEFQQKCLGKMQDVADAGRTVVFVSHNMTMICELCDRAILLKGGSVSNDGKPDDIVPLYLSDVETRDDGDYDLSDHSGRDSKYKSLIKRLVVKNELGEPTSNHISGNGIRFEMSLNLPDKVNHPRLAISFEDNFGKRITTVTNYFENVDFPDSQGDVNVWCDLKRLELGEGSYLITVSILDKNANGLIDSVSGAAKINVAWCNYFSNGEGYHSAYGPVLSRSQWGSLETTGKGERVKPPKQFSAEMINGQ